MELTARQHNGKAFTGSIAGGTAPMIKGTGPNEKKAAQVQHDCKVSIQA
jgi:hypothetical protein